MGVCGDETPDYVGNPAFSRSTFKFEHIPNLQHITVKIRHFPNSQDFIWTLIIQHESLFPEWIEKSLTGSGGGGGGGSLITWRFKNKMSWEK